MSANFKPNGMLSSNSFLRVLSAMHPFLRSTRRLDGIPAARNDHTLLTLVVVVAVAVAMLVTL